MGKSPRACEVDYRILGARATGPGAKPSEGVTGAGRVATRPPLIAQAGLTNATGCRRAETLQVPRPRSSDEPVHLLVDSTGEAVRSRRVAGRECAAEAHGKGG